jgi:hypothetical protein
MNKIVLYYIDIKLSVNGSLFNKIWKKHPNIQDYFDSLGIIIRISRGNIKRVIEGELNE